MSDVKRFVRMLVSGNRVECRNIVQAEMEEGLSPIELYQDFLTPALYEVGRLWESNRVSVAAEHMATAIVEDIIGELFELFYSTVRQNRRVVIASVEDEPHQVGGRMVADLFEKHGWETLYLGGNTPWRELFRIVEKTEPDVVALSLTVYFHVGTLIHTIGELKKSFPRIQILVGGQALGRNGHVFASEHGVMHAATLRELETVIDTMEKNV